LNICYYHQDLHWCPFHVRSRCTLRHFVFPTRQTSRPAELKGNDLEHHALLLMDLFWFSQGESLRSMARSKWFAWASSIFGASSFGTWVVTHSWADSDFHGHRRAVYMNQHPFWYLMSKHLDTLTAAIGSSRIASPAYQKWPTWSSGS